MSKDLWPSFINSHPDLEMLENGKCKCKITGHEMLPKKDIVEAHISGKKYRQAKAKQQADEFDWKQYEPNIVQSKKDPTKLFCHLTKTSLNKTPEEIKLHVNGRRFRARLAEREELLARKREREAKKQAAASKRDDGEVDPALARLSQLVDDSSDSIGEEEEEEEEEEEGEDGSDEEPQVRKKGKTSIQGKQHMPAQEVAEDEDSGFEEVAQDDSGEDSEDESRSPSPPPGGTSAQQSDHAKEKHHGRSKQAQPMVKTIEIVHKKRGKPGERKGKAGREQAKKQKK